MDPWVFQGCGGGLTKQSPLEVKAGILQGGVGWPSDSVLCVQPPPGNGMECGLRGSCDSQRSRAFNSFSFVSDSLRPRALSMEFSRQEYRSGLPFPSPGNLPDPGLEPGSCTLKADSLLSAPLGNSSLTTNSGHGQWDSSKWITETLKMFIVVLASPAAFGIYCYLVNESVLAF